MDRQIVCQHLVVTEGIAASTVCFRIVKIVCINHLSLLRTPFITSLFYHDRFNEVKEGYKLPLKSCEELYSNGKRNGCYLKDAFTNQDIYMLVRSEAGQTTFKAFYGWCYFLIV